MISGAATAPARPRGWFPEHRDRNEQGKTKQVDIIACSPIPGSMYAKSSSRLDLLAGCPFAGSITTRRLLSRYGHFSPSCRVFRGLIKPALKDLSWDITSKSGKLCWERCSNCYIYLERDLEVTPPQGRGVSSQMTCLGNWSGSTE